MCEDTAEKGSRPNHIVEAVACPDCKAEKGQECTTFVDGVDTGWTHDNRAYAAMFRNEPCVTSSKVGDADV